SIPGAALPDGPPLTTARGQSESPLPVRTTLLEIVAERTGYPPEMLEDDLDVEADLGIDSIKRVEIIGSFLRTCAPDDAAKIQQAMDQLVRIKSIGALAVAVEGALAGMGEPDVGGGPAAAPNAAPAVPQERPSDGVGLSTDEAASQLPRLVLEPVEAPRPSGADSPTVGTLVVTDDEQGVGESLATMVRAGGGRAVLVRMGDGGPGREPQPAEGPSVGADDAFESDLTDPDAVANLIGSIRSRHGPMSGLLHLLPLKDPPSFESLDLAGWRGRLDLEVKSLLLLGQALAPDLRGAGGPGFVLAVTRSRGPFEAGGWEGDGFPGQGGVAGLVKTLALEWPGVRCKTVDIAGGLTVSETARTLLGEVRADDNLVDVAYRGRTRMVLRPRQAPLDGHACNREKQSALDLSPGSVVLVTGGARGITAELALELARRWRPTLVLVGRTTLPVEGEAPSTIGLTDPRDLKAALMEPIRTAGGRLSPSEVEAAYMRLVRSREIRANLAAIRDLGAIVEYRQLDVRDGEAFTSLIEELYRSYGRLDGVIHGAGIVEDRLVEDKTPDSFDRVLDTKAAGAFVLARALRPESLSFLVFCSSVAGCFGNRGQCDYAAANGVLNTLAGHLDRSWPGRVVSINWGPWEMGMVSPELRRRFADRGVPAIAPEAGRLAFWQELARGTKGDAVVILGGGPWVHAAGEDRRDEVGGPGEAPAGNVR
ncbi:MAG: SDR family NAD(P)-dependent oxidoreductase, partial [Actinomycetota bacterium]